MATATEETASFLRWLMTNQRGDYTVAACKRVLETLQDPSASRISWLSEAEPWGGYLYLGSFQGDHIARVNASRLWPAAAS